MGSGRYTEETHLATHLGLHLLLLCPIRIVRFVVCQTLYRTGLTGFSVLITFYDEMVMPLWTPVPKKGKKKKTFVYLGFPSINRPSNLTVIMRNQIPFRVRHQRDPSTSATSSLELPATRPSMMFSSLLLLNYYRSFNITIGIIILLILGSVRVHPTCQPRSKEHLVSCRSFCGTIQ